jgi:hypothetical protein
LRNVAAVLVLVQIKDKNWTKYESNLSINFSYINTDIDPPIIAHSSSFSSPDDDNGSFGDIGVPYSIYQPRSIDRNKNEEPRGSKGGGGHKNVMRAVEYCFDDYGDKDGSGGTYSHRICQPNNIVTMCDNGTQARDNWFPPFGNNSGPRVNGKEKKTKKKKKRQVAAQYCGATTAGTTAATSFISSVRGGNAREEMRTKQDYSISINDDNIKEYYFDDDVNSVGSYSHLICPTKEGKDDELWPGSSPAFALARLPPFVGKKKKMRADQGLRGVEKRKKKWNNQIEPPFPADCKLCVEISTLHSNDDDEQKAENRGRGKPEAVEREFTKKKKKTGTHFSGKRPYSL